MESQFADDVVLYTRTHGELDPAARKEACLWSLQVSIEFNFQQFNSMSTKEQCAKQCASSCYGQEWKHGQSI